VSNVPEWLQYAIPIILIATPVLWVVVCLFAVNWRKAWPALKEGAWVPLVLVTVLMAVVWSQIWPSGVANFWLQLVILAAFVGLGLFTGWVQDRYSWTQSEVPVEPVVHGHSHGNDHGHDHSHGHDHDHDHANHSHGHH
jgi:ABC-type nickel/cobalt efflux system permease component RcnA